mmetsp:Transcript_1362/g.4276  ORF Transcript_1362/g.4276 Transcript_1362/m.4276 type:complete len:226 (+) Transcript_1362:309-986(+)
MPANRRAAAREGRRAPWRSGEILVLFGIIHGELVRPLPQGLEHLRQLVSRVDGPRGRGWPGESRIVLLAQHLVLHRGPGHPHVQHGNNAHAGGLQEGAVQARAGHDQLHLLLRSHAPPRPGSWQGLRHVTAYRGRPRPRGVHQRRPSKQPLHLHCQGRRRALRCDDNEHYAGHHLHDPSDRQAPAGYHRAGGRGGRCHQRHAGRPAPHRPWGLPQLCGAKVLQEG